MVVTKKPRLKVKSQSKPPVSLREDIAYGRGADFRIDEDAGIVYGVKILGWTSKNGRRYLPEAVAAKLNLYEGVRVFIDHGSRGDQVRDMEDFFGTIEKPRMMDDGVYGDFHYLKTHPFATQFVESAKRFKNSFGFS